MSPSNQATRIGIMTDLHYADMNLSPKRDAVASLHKVQRAVQWFTDLHLAERPLDALVVLGDTIDTAESPDREIENLAAIRRALLPLPCPSFFALGNHCLEHLSKPQVLSAISQPKSRYWFDIGLVRCLVLDACFRPDGIAYDAGNFDWELCDLPDAELAWIAEQVESSPKPIVVFCHQRLDTDDRYGVENATAIRQVLSKPPVMLVVQGHNHCNDHRQLDGVTYLTMTAMVDAKDNAFGLLEIAADGSFRLEGIGEQASYSSQTGSR